MKNNKTYSERGLVEFGNYLLSKEREKHIDGDNHGKRTINLIEKRREVYHADLENWKNKK
ncbi:hypothetical protein [Chryseobacterium proteolyticum]|uniref:hypothetical protein n=1 Tax=Chryseobacterium proteolyticum TaxID=118127 RepID=UPI00398376D5